MTEKPTAPRFHASRAEIILLREKPLSNNSTKTFQPLVPASEKSS
jgi:hypothetical protein